MGLWSSCGVIIPPDVQPGDAWDFYILLLQASSEDAPTTTANDLVPQEMYGLQLRCAAGDAGELGMGELFELWRNWELCFADRGFPARFTDLRFFPAGARAHRHFVAGWRARVEAPCRWVQAASAVAMRAGKLTCSTEGSPVTIVGSVERCLDQ